MKVLLEQYEISPNIFRHFLLVKPHFSLLKFQMAPLACVSRSVSARFRMLQLD
uniref:Uncharacterized protein n=1 Tax=Anguilla anguilla TaxID=7936 RepID=A0A0E9T655_ANGAN